MSVAATLAASFLDRLRELPPWQLAAIAIGIIALVLVIIVLLVRAGQETRPLGPEAGPAGAQGTLEQLAAGLSKTRAVLGRAIRNLFTRKLAADSIEGIEEAMLGADMGIRTSSAIVEDLKLAYREKKIERSEDALDYLKADLKAKLRSVGTELAKAATGPTVVLVAGVNGTGKTTSIAKLASLIKSQGKRVLLCAGDTFRAAAVEQLKIWAERVDCEIVTTTTGADPASVAYDAAEAAVARDVDYLIVDTAGRLHTHQNLMAELGKIRRVIQKKIPAAPHEVLLVLDATTGQNAIAQAKEFQRAIEVTGIFLAKLDGTAKGGIVVAIRQELDIPVKFIGIGERIDAIQRFDPDRFVEALFAPA